LELAVEVVILTPVEVLILTSVEELEVGDLALELE
jgi:hypothetical protein